MWSVLRSILSNVCWRNIYYCLLIRTLRILPIIWTMCLRLFGNRSINWVSRVKKPATMRYAICGELRESFIIGLMFLIRLRRLGNVFGIRNMPEKYWWRIVIAMLTEQLSSMLMPRNWSKGQLRLKNWWTTILRRPWNLRKNIWKPWNLILQVGKLISEKRWWRRIKLGWIWLGAAMQYGQLRKRMR